MDLLAILVTITSVYILVCIILSFFTDGDLTTVMYSTFRPGLSRGLEGKVIWVTGASRGLGAALAVAAAKHGARLIISARTKSGLEKTKTDCLDAGRYRDLKSEDVLVLPFDLSNTEDHQKLCQTAVEKMGKISGVVHCVGRLHHDNWEKTDLAVDRELLTSCVLGTVSLTRVVLPHMIDRNSGMLGLVSCVEATLGAPFMGSVSGYKQALHGYFQSLRHEILSYGISVSHLVCGPVDLNSPDNVSKQATLCLVGLVNNIHYSWACSYPFLTMMYLHHYLPDICSRFTSFVGPRIVAKIRTKYGAADQE